jgi:hypothetical protein
MPIEIAKTIFALFHMATLPSFLKCLLRENERNEWETYTRSTINSEQAAKEE